MKTSIAALGTCLLLTWAATGAPARATGRTWGADLASARALATSGIPWYASKYGPAPELKTLGTLSAIEMVAHGTADFATSARPADPDTPIEQQLLFLPVAWDALVLVVHPSNPIQSLSAEQLRDIYLGRIRGWKSLAGVDRPINLYAVAGPLDGVEWSLRRHLFGHGGARVAAQRWYINTQQLEDAVAIDPLGIGVSLLSNTVANPKLKLLAIEGVQPDRASLKSGSYPLATALYMAVRREQPEQQQAQGFAKQVFDWMQGDAGLHRAWRKQGLLVQAHVGDAPARWLAQESQWAARLGFAHRMRPLAVALAPLPPPPHKFGPANRMRRATQDVFKSPLPLAVRRNDGLKNPQIALKDPAGLACRPRWVCV